MVEARFPGIVIQAVGLTFGTLGALLMAYRSGLIRATENFKLGVVADIQPAWLYLDARTLSAQFGNDRLRFVQPLRTIFENGTARSIR